MNTILWPALLLCSVARAQGLPADPAPALPSPWDPPPLPPVAAPHGAPEPPDAAALPAGEGVITAALVRYDEAARVWIATGNVTIRYRQYILRGDTGEYDLDTETAILRGDVSLDTGQNVMRGGPNALLTFHFPDRTWSFTRASTELRLTGLLEPVHISAGALSGARQEIMLRDVRLTTCPPESPQYDLAAREVTLVPDRYLVARRATAHLFGRRLWTVPAVRIPIRREATERPGLFPEVGQSAEEGAFLKASMGYTAGAGQTGALRVDLMQKRGLGLGVTHDYQFGGASGKAGLYSVGGFLGGGRDVSANLRHTQRVLGFNATAQGELRRNSYLYLPGTTSRNATLSLDRASAASETRFTLRYDATRGVSVPFHQLATGAAQTWRFSPRGTARLALDESRQSSMDAEGKPDTARERTTTVDISQGFAAADLQVAYNRLQHLGGGQPFVYRPVQRLPEITFRSDARRLGLTSGKGAPARMELSTGWFNANGVSSDRQSLRLDLPERALPLGGARLTIQGGFRQAVYASDAALYSLNAVARATQRLGTASDVSLAWTVQAPRGYSPFVFDRPYVYNAVTASLRVADVRWLEVRIGSGYDFRNDHVPWRDLLAYAKIEPSDRYRFTTSTAVNVNGREAGRRSHVRYVNNSLRLRLGRFRLDGESRYLPSTGRFGRLMGDVGTPLGRDWSIRALVGTAAGQRYRRLLVVRDMGCLEAYVAAVDDRGWRNERGVRVMLRIKAFPMAEPFSAGMFGESLEVGAPDAAYGGVAESPLAL